MGRKLDILNTLDLLDILDEGKSILLVQNVQLVQQVHSPSPQKERGKEPAISVFLPPVLF